MSSIALIAVEIHCKMLQLLPLFRPIFDSPRFELMLQKEPFLDDNAIINEHSVGEHAWDGIVIDLNL
jgi:hypothetical protein